MSLGPEKDISSAKRKVCLLLLNIAGAASLLSNIGKAIVVVMIMFQIAGVGSIYPIQANSEILGLLDPLWPFTYAIDHFLEVIAAEI